MFVPTVADGLLVAMGVNSVIEVMKNSLAVKLDLPQRRPINVEPSPCVEIIVFGGAILVTMNVAHSPFPRGKIHQLKDTEAIRGSC